MTRTDWQREGKHRRIWALVGCVLLFGCGFLTAFGIFEGGRDDRPVLVDARAKVEADGALFTFTVPGPAAVRIDAQLEGCCEDTTGDVTLARLLPALRPHLVFEPESSHAQQFTVTTAPKASGSTPLKHGGTYAVYVKPIPNAMGDMAATAHVRVVYLGAM